MSVHEVVDPELLHMNALAPPPRQRKGSLESPALVTEQRGSAPSLARSGAVCVHQWEMPHGLRRAASWKGRLLHGELTPLATLIFGSVPVLL